MNVHLPDFPLVGSVWTMALWVLAVCALAGLFSTLPAGRRWKILLITTVLSVLLTVVGIAALTIGAACGGRRDSRHRDQRWVSDNSGDRTMRHGNC